MDIVNDIKRTFKEGSVLTRLIYINIGVFLLLKIIGIFFYLSGQPFSFAEYLAVPSSTAMLILRPWTLITYMFYHIGFMHLLFNMLGLYWFGQLFLYHFEGNKLLSVYLFGGLAGAALYIISYNIFPAFASVNGLLLGASAAILAILVAVAFYDPNRELYFFFARIRLKYVALFYVALSIIYISSSNPGGNIAHLGGAFWGWFYIYQLRKGKDLGAGFVRRLNQLGIFCSEKFKHGQKMKVTYKQAPSRDDHEYARQQHFQQEELNRILDKIAKSGYSSLTKQEKELLFKQGRK